MKVTPANQLPWQGTTVRYAMPQWQRASTVHGSQEAVPYVKSKHARAKPQGIRISLRRLSIKPQQGDVWTHVMHAHSARHVVSGPSITCVH